jgi:hypothetical protein
LELIHQSPAGHVAQIVLFGNGSDGFPGFFDGLVQQFERFSQGDSATMKSGVRRGRLGVFAPGATSGKRGRPFAEVGVAAFLAHKALFPFEPAQPLQAVQISGKFSGKSCRR